jgi:Glu-tRNA(Gln) amidotransferase subunit E-like FAD-binding protein
MEMKKKEIGCPIDHIGIKLIECHTDPEINSG